MREELSVDEVSALLGVPVTTLRRWADYREALRRDPTMPRRVSEPPELGMLRPDGTFGHTHYRAAAVQAFMEANGMEFVHPDATADRPWSAAN